MTFNHHLFFLFRFIFINFILILTSVYDLSTRSVANKFWKTLFFLALISNIMEGALERANFGFFLFFKLFGLFFTFLTTFILYNLKVLGGSDCKLVILIFLIQPVELLQLFYLSLFFLIFLGLHNLTILARFLKNTIYSRELFDSLCYSGKIIQSRKKRLFLKSFYDFEPYHSGLRDYDRIKKELKSKYLFFSLSSKKLCLLFQPKLPMILLLTISFYILFFIPLSL